MPLANEHAARIHDPGKYDKIRRENNKFGDGVHVLWGIKDGKSEVQSIHFDASKFTADEARAWLKDHEYKPIEFEPATGKIAKEAVMGEALRKMFSSAIAKEFDDQERSIVAWGSKAIVDRDNELIMGEAWNTSEFVKNPVLMFAHDYKMPPVGKILWVKTTPEGLKFKAQFATSAAGEEVYQLYKGGFMSAFSAGFKPKAWEDNPNVTDVKGVKPKRLFTEVMLMEISCVPIPANPEALVEMTKSIKTKALSDAVIALNERKDVQVTETEDQPVETKMLSLEGAMSIGDIGNLLDGALRAMATPDEYVYLVDFWPTKYPDGQSVFCRITEGSVVQRQLFVCDYSIVNGVVQIGEATPVAEAYVTKCTKALERGISGEAMRTLLDKMKVLDEMVVELKENRMISTKNLEKLRECADSMETSTGMLRDMIKMAEESIKPRDDKKELCPTCERVMNEEYETNADGARSLKRKWCGFCVEPPKPEPVPVVKEEDVVEIEEESQAPQTEEDVLALEPDVVKSVVKSAVEKTIPVASTLVKEAIAQMKGKVYAE